MTPSRALPLGPARTRGALLLLAGLISASHVACRAESDGSPGAPAESTSSAPLVSAPELRDDTAGILLVWLDEQGDFHTQGRVSEVPAAGRELVRIIFESSSAPSADRVWVADLRQKSPDGRYPVNTLPRVEWEKRGLAQRLARVEQSRPAAPPVEPPADGAQLDVDVVVYGADWCKPCHMAEAYLKKLGARVVKKDIEEDPKAAAEMRQKLQAAGLGGAGIPVLDVGGTVLVGFSEAAIDAALRRRGAR